MKKLPLVLSGLVLIFAAVNVQAHELRRGHGYHSNSYSYYSPFPSTSLIAGISFRNYNNRIGLQNRIYNSRISNQRSYQRGYRNGYRDAQRFQSRNYRDNRYRNQSCYEIYYDRFGNRIRRSLPASACRY